MNEDRIHKIRDRAHALWEEAGRPHGQDAEHWAQAERQIAAEEDAGTSNATKTNTGRRGRKAKTGADQAGDATSATQAQLSLETEASGTAPGKKARRASKAVTGEGAVTPQAARGRRAKATSEEAAISSAKTKREKPEAAAPEEGSTIEATPSPKAIAAAEGSDTAE